MKSKIDLDYLGSKLSELEHEIIDTPLSPKQICNKIKGALTAVDMKMYLVRKYTVQYDTIRINGCNDPYKNPAIRIYVMFHTDQATINLKVNDWIDFKHRLVGAILHELRHEEQRNKRRRKGQREVSLREIREINNTVKLDNAIYMGDPDEIDAYAYYVANLLFMNFSEIQVIDIFRNIRRAGELDVTTNRYLHFFKNSSSIRKKFFKKVYKFYNSCK